MIDRATSGQRQSGPDTEDVVDGSDPLGRRTPCACPLTVGGGVRSVEDVRALLLAGADKAGINTAAVHDPELVRRVADAFGSQALVVAVDAGYRDSFGA